MPHDVQCITIGGKWSNPYDLIVGCDVSAERADAEVAAGDATRVTRQVPDVIRWRDTIQGLQLTDSYEAVNGRTYPGGSVLTVGEDITAIEAFAMLRANRAFELDRQAPSP
jgi:hypothetical protein